MCKRGAGGVKGTVAAIHEVNHDFGWSAARKQCSSSASCCSHGLLCALLPSPFVLPPRAPTNRPLPPDHRPENTPLTYIQQEEYIKEEQKNLKRELLRAQEEVKRIQSVPLVIGQFLEMVDANTGIVGSTTGSNYHVRILSTLNRELLKPSASVALHRHSNALVDVLPPEADSSISLLGDNEKPNITYQVIRAFGCCVRLFAVVCLHRIVGAALPREREQGAAELDERRAQRAPWKTAAVSRRRRAPTPPLPIITCTTIITCTQTYTRTGHRRLRHPEAGDPRGRRAAADAGRPLPPARHRPAAVSGREERHCVFCSGELRG